jgi:hypothetical protein
MAELVSSVCTNALREIGAVALEETPTNGELQAALLKLNDMIESWNTQRLTVYAQTQALFPITANKASYTFGPGGDWNAVRPLKITEAYSRDSQGNDFPIKVVNYDEYSTILPKYITSALAQKIYFDNAFPLMSAFPWPRWSDASYQANIWSWNAIGAFANLNTNIILPPAYARAIKYNLALECGPQFGREITKDLAMLAVSSKAEIKRLNTVVLQMGFDSALLKRPGGYAWQAQCFGGVS